MSGRSSGFVDPSVAPHPTGSSEPKDGRNDGLCCDICVVGEGHRINVPVGYGTITIAELEYSHDTAVSVDVEDLPRVQVNLNNSFYAAKVTGTGIFTEWLNNVTDPVVTGDFGEFSNQKYSWFLFVASGTDVDIPTNQVVFPNVMTEGNGYSLTLFLNSG